MTTSKPHRFHSGCYPILSIRNVRHQEKDGWSWLVFEKKNQDHQSGMLERDGMSNANIEQIQSSRKQDRLVSSKQTHFNINSTYFLLTDCHHFNKIQHQVEIESLGAPRQHSQQNIKILLYIFDLILHVKSFPSQLYHHSWNDNFYNFY